MALSEERIGQIAVKVLVHKLKKEGLMVRPKDLKSEVFNGAKSIGVSPVEMAEFMRLGFNILFKEMNQEIDSLVSSVEGWQPKAE